MTSRARWRKWTITDRFLPLVSLPTESEARKSHPNEVVLHAVAGI